MIIKDFGNRIIELRQLKKMSQKQLAKDTGISREQISRIENGQINPTLETIAKLGDAFDCSLSELFLFEIKQDEFIVKPFVKWAGGKNKITNQIKQLMPEKYNSYFEPFLGGGALLFYLKPTRAFINDMNKELIQTYKIFQNDAEYNKLILKLIEHENKHSEEYYYEVRALDRNSNFKDLEDYEKSARMIYLNKACFNGLYRVNSKGYFNVPSGKKQQVKTFDRKNFESLRRYFTNNEIHMFSEDFTKCVEFAKKGDFVYFDPPYDKFENQKNFTAYNKDGFNQQDQERLARVFKELDNKGVYVMLSNHNTKFINKLYDGYKINVIDVKRMINSDANGRGNVEEVIITNY